MCITVVPDYATRHISLQAFKVVGRLQTTFFNSVFPQNKGFEGEIKHEYPITLFKVANKITKTAAYCVKKGKQINLVCQEQLEAATRRFIESCFTDVLLSPKSQFIPLECSLKFNNFTYSSEIDGLVAKFLRDNWIDGMCHARLGCAPSSISSQPTQMLFDFRI